jgi:hypothetical protein
MWRRADPRPVARRLQCVNIIEPGQMSHAGAHIHTNEEQPFHFCETRYVILSYILACNNQHTIVAKPAVTSAPYPWVSRSRTTLARPYTCYRLLQGHTQQEHETSHGSMTRTRWAIDGTDETDIELGGRKFSANDEGAPMMCNLVCSSMGRHVHIEYCDAGENARCQGPELQHISARMTPNPDRPKDAITHNLYWRRMGMLSARIPFLLQLKTSYLGFKGHEHLSLV